MDISLKKTTTPTTFFSRRQNTDRAKFLQKLGELMEEGFFLKDALQFLELVLPKQQEWIEQVEKGMENGSRLDEELKKAAFPETITAQLFLAHIHGHLTETLIGCGKQMEDQLKKQQELVSLLQYPLLLVLFLVGMLLSMRFLLLPHIESMMGVSGQRTDKLANLAVSFVYYSPYWLTGALAAALIFALLLHWSLKKKTAVEKAAFFCRLPVLKSFMQLYYTHRFGQEWSLLFRSGLNMQEIVRLMQTEGTSQLMKETGTEMGKILKEGYDFKKALEQFPFLLKEMGFIVLHGESTGKLDLELSIYAKDCLRELNIRTQRAFQYIQPLLFLFIALMVLSIYAALLLPMFSMVKEIG